MFGKSYHCMKHKRGSPNIAGPTFYVVAMAPEVDIAYAAIQLLSDAGLVAREGEGSRHFGYPVCCTELERARAVITACSAYRTGDMDIYLLSHPKREGEHPHLEDFAGLAAYRQHMIKRLQICSGLIAEPHGPANSSHPINTTAQTTPYPPNSGRQP